MKHLIFSLAGIICFVFQQPQIFAQTNGIPFTGDYSVNIERTHILEKDAEGNMTKAINIVPGTGTHSILGEVTTISIVRFDASKGDNIIEFTETDADGNSLFLKTKGIPKADGNWKCHGSIMGGTGKYQNATGYYIANGLSQGTVATWAAEGMLYFTSEDEEREAIKKVIAAETQAYIDKDFQAMDDSYLIAPFTTNVANMPQGTAVMQHRYKTGNPPIRNKELVEAMIPLSNIERYDWNIQLRGDVAWVVYNQKLDAMGSRVPSIETRILEKFNGQWKMTYSSTMIDYQNTNPPLPTLTSSASERTYSVHEIGLKPGVEPEDFEAFINDTIAPIYNKMKGQEFILAKADRGERKDQYSIVMVFDSKEDRDRIYPENGESPEDWGPQENWLKLNALTTGLGTKATLYSDYVELKK